jgi:hypothetical protein
MTDNARRTGAALEAHYQFLAWLESVYRASPIRINEYTA